MTGEDEDALPLLREALGWRMSADGWDQVDAAVGELADAVAKGSADVKHVIALELLVPGRIGTRVGDRPVVDIPPDIRDRINELVERLVVKPDSATRPRRADGGG